MSTDQPFWKRKTLAELSTAEWESLCDGCGLCCLQKLEDEEDGSIHYTRIACKLLDLNSCRCRDYDHRLAKVPHCLQLTPAHAAQFHWLPETCAYRLVAAGQDLPGWHPLVCGDPMGPHRAGISLAGRMISEVDVDEDDWEDHIIVRIG